MTWNVSQILNLEPGWYWLIVEDHKTVFKVSGKDYRTVQTFGYGNAVPLKHFLSLYPAGRIQELPEPQ